VNAPAPLGAIAKARLIDGKLGAALRAAQRGQGLGAVHAFKAHAYDRAAGHALEAAHVVARVDETPLDALVRW
jgi:hypothetical protein